jgi:beta-lactamase regulating signal transducer with metallopeptidase domain
MILPTLTECAAAIDRHWPAIIYLAARSAIVMGVAGAVVLAMRRASASARHWVWLMGFIGLLILPALSAVIPAWRVLPWKDDALVAVSYEITEPPVLPEFAAPERIEVPKPDATSSAIRESTPVREIDSVAASAGAAPMASVQHEPVAPPGPASTKRPALPWTFWVAAAWLAGSLAVFARVALGYISLWWLQRRCTRITHGSWCDMLDTLRQQLDLRPDVRLLRTPLRTMPMTWGIWRTRILLPDESADWPAEQRRAVLLHELAHVRRRDCLTQFIAQLGCAIYWFNPLVWLAWRRMQIDRERACDDLVLSAGEKASAYARHLLDSAAAMPSLPVISAAALAMARASTLEERLRAILDLKRNRRAITLRLATATALLVALALIPVAALRAQQQQAPPAPAPADANLTVEERMRLRRQGDVGTPADASGTMTLEQQMRQRRQTNATTAPADANLTVEERMRQRRLEGGGALPVASGARGGQRIGGSMLRPEPGEGPTSPMDATIYDLRLPADQIGRLDVEALNRVAGSAVEFEKALAALGTAQPLYRARQSVRLSGDSISIGQTMPYVRATNTNTAGQQLNSVAYSQTGAIFNLGGTVGASGDIDLAINIQVSSMGDSSAALSGNVNAPAFRSTTLSYRGTVSPGKPFVIISVDSSAVETDGKATARIARVTMGAPQKGAAVGQ